MNRRSFLKSLAALAATPAIAPVTSGLAMASTSASGAVTTSSATYKWAEVIVRAHNSCTTAMLQRHLGLDAIGAQALQRQLISNGVVAARANAYGIRAAVKPLNDIAFLNSGGNAGQSVSAIEHVNKAIEVVSDDAVLAEPETSNAVLASDMREAEDFDCDVACLGSALGDDLHHFSA